MKNHEIAKAIAAIRPRLPEGLKSSAAEHINEMVSGRPGRLARKLALEFLAYAKKLTKTLSPG